jgi:hypothetical protein
MPERTEVGPVRRYIRSTAFGANVLGVHAATWAVSERLGAVVAAIEVLLFVTIVLTALFGREKFSDRAFRLLRRSPYSR